MPGYTVRVMSDRDVIAALVSDLHWQIDQMPIRGIKNSAGNPYNPSYYKRGLANAIARGDLAVAEYVRSYLHKPPSDGFKKLEEADSLDLACEALVIDDSKPYAHLFTDDERRIARQRLAPHVAAIERRRAASQSRVEATRRTLPEGLDDLRALAAAEANPEDSVAINTEIIRRAPDDVVAMIRLGRAYEALGQLEQAVAEYERALLLEPANRIVERRLRDAERQLQRRSRTR